VSKQTYSEYIIRILKNNNDDTRRTIKTELSSHRSATIIFTDSNNEINHLRVSGIPESKHKEIYKLLDVKDPTKRINKLAGIISNFLIMGSLSVLNF